MNLSSLTITPELLRIIAEIDEFKGGWRTLNHQSPERLKALKRFVFIESIRSSTRIGCAKLTDKEIENLLSNLGNTSFESRDEQEVAGYAEIMVTAFDSFNDIPITENYIKQPHSNLGIY